jgi:hypothetical protein
MASMRIAGSPRYQAYALAINTRLTTVNGRLSVTPKPPNVHLTMTRPPILCYNQVSE